MAFYKLIELEMASARNGESKLGRNGFRGFGNTRLAAHRISRKDRKEIAAVRDIHSHMMDYPEIGPVKIVGKIGAV